MARYQRISSVIFLLAAALLFGCSSAPTADDTDTSAKKLTGPADLVQTQDVLLAVRMEIDGLSTLTSLLQRLSQTMNEEGLRELADISPDPIGHLQHRGGFPNDLPSLSRDEAGYFLFSQRGNEQFLTAAALGLPTRAEEAPKFFNIRALLPTDSPETLMEELKPWLAALEDDPDFAATRVFPGPGFVRLELAVSIAPETPGGDQWLDDLRLDQLQPPSSAEYRPTPAFDAFVDSDAPLGVWAPVESLGTLGILEVFQIFESERQMVGPAGTPRFSLEGVARVAAASSIVDPVSAENEDFSILFSADESGTLIIDTYNTRTAQGTRVHHALNEPVSLPGFNTANTFLELSWQVNFEALKNTIVAPFWQLLEAESEGDEWGDAAMQGSAFGGVDTGSFSPVKDSALFPTLAMALQYPWASLSMGADSMGGLFPLPRALALEAFAIPDSAMLPVGAVLAGTFPNTPQNRMTIEGLLQAGESTLPMGFDATLLEREDGLIEVRVALGEELAKVFSSSQPPNQVSDTKLSLDVTPLQMLGGMIPGGEAMDLFDHIHVRGHSEDAYSTFRITFGAAEALSPHRVESRVDPRPNPTYRCQAEISSAAVEHLSDLRTDATGRVEAWATAVEERAAKCMEPNHPYVSMLRQRIELAREIAAEIP